MNLINTTAFQKCKNIPSLNFDSIIHDCVLDAVASNSMDWTAHHLESIKTKCVHEVKAEQLPPPEALEGVTIEINGVEYTNITEENITLPVLQEFRSDALEEIENVVCTNECNERGLCVNGTCVCNKPYIGDDCSVDPTLPPEMLGIPDEGICDLQIRPCKRVYVIAKYLADTRNLTCRLTPFAVTEDANTFTMFDHVDVQGELDTFLEASCELPGGRVKRFAKKFVPDDVIATGYLVALSNDGVTFSEEDTLALFDSDCVECGKVKGDIVCRRKPGFCVTSGKCYHLNETIDCLKCTGQPDEILSWQPDCKETKEIKMDGDGGNKMTWLIPAVLTPIFAFGIGVIVLIIRYKRKTETITFSAVEMNPRNEETAVK